MGKYGGGICRADEGNIFDHGYTAPDRFYCDKHVERENLLPNTKDYLYTLLETTPCRWVTTYSNGRFLGCKNARTSQKSRNCKDHEVSHSQLLKEKALAKQKQAKAKAVAVEAEKFAEAQMKSGGVENLELMIAQLQLQLAQARKKE